MFARVPLFPLVTTSRTQFIKDIAVICEACNIENYRKEEWIQRVESSSCEAHYFVGIIFVEKMSFYLLLHELIHHVMALMRRITQSRIWYKLDYTLDGLDIFIFRKK